MNKIGFTKISLRDLGILACLIEHGRISPVAKKFSISTSAVSYALERLHQAFGETLLIRTSHGFKPTELGRLYARLATEFLNELETAQSGEPFDPESMTRSFNLVATDYELNSFLGSSLRTILDIGANLSVNIIETKENFRLERLFEDIHIVFAPLGIDRAGITQELVLEDEYATFYDPSKRDAPDSMNAFCLAPHAVVAENSVVLNNVDRALSHLGAKRTIRLIAPNFSALAGMVGGTDMITTLPSSLANGCFAHLSKCAPPVTLSSLKIYLTYADVRESDPGFQWLKQMIMRHVGQA